MQLSRRIFLKGSAMAMAGVGAAPSWLARAAAATSGDAGRRKVLVVIFQRGAVDGLNVVVPHGDSNYYTLRPSISIPRERVLDLDGTFGLHPSLASLKSIYDAGHLAIIDAVGSPDPTRSHFDAQDYMESGTPGVKATPDGWLNRALPQEAAPAAVRAIAMGTSLPRSLRGRSAALAIGNLNEFQLRDPQTASVFESLYAAAGDPANEGSQPRNLRGHARPAVAAETALCPEWQCAVSWRAGRAESAANCPDDQGQRRTGSGVHRCRRVGYPRERGRGDGRHRATRKPA